MQKTIKDDMYPKTDSLQLEFGENPHEDDNSPKLWIDALSREDHVPIVLDLAGSYELQEIVSAFITAAQDAEDARNEGN